MLAIAVALGALGLPASAHAQSYAPIDHPGPALTVPQSKLDSALVCTGSVTGATTDPVLLVHGTGSDPDHNFSWNWVPALDALGIPWCTVALPGRRHGRRPGRGRVRRQRDQEHASALRPQADDHRPQPGGNDPALGAALLARHAGDGGRRDRPGAQQPRHRDAPSSPASPTARPAIWQQRADSEFIKALNSGQETFAGVSYTQVYTHTDPVVTPNLDDTGSSSLHTGDGAITNVAIQDLCPTDVNEHLAVGHHRQRRLPPGDRRPRPTPARPIRRGSTRRPSACSP